MLLQLTNETLGIDLVAGGRSKKASRTAPKSDDVHFNLLVELSLALYDVPALKVTALKFTETVRARILNGKARTAWYIPVQQLTSTRTGRYRAVLLRGPKNAREAVKHFGKAPGVPHSYTNPYARSKVRQFERAGGRRNGRGFRVRVSVKGPTASLATHMRHAVPCAHSTPPLCFTPRVDHCAFVAACLPEAIVILILAVADAIEVSGSSDGYCNYNHISTPRPHSVTITEFGAVGDGVTLNTVAFQNAVFYLRSFADKGGAQLYVPQGRWLTGSFNLTSHLTLFLETDAVIIGSGISFIYVEHLHIDNSLTGINFKTTRGRGGFIEDIVVSNVEMENVREAFRFTGHCGGHPNDEYDPDALPKIKQVTLKNIVGTNISTAGFFSGIENDPFTAICLSNIALSVTSDPSNSWSCSNVSGYSESVFPDPCSDLNSNSSFSCFSLDFTAAAVA
ncbi:hypothetical protein GW17_00004216 [Ensete ventricosum]|nr:hypothetical protein GW17_00004216 [Ensete ventricosum]